MKLRTPSNTWTPSGSGRRYQPIFRSTIESMAANHDTERSGGRKSLITPTGVCARLRPTTTAIETAKMATRANRRSSMSYLRSKLGFSLLFTYQVFQYFGQWLDKLGLVVPVVVVLQSTANAVFNVVDLDILDRNPFDCSRIA